jgi:hypothetical protein
MESKELRQLNIEKIKEKPSKFVPSREALKDVVPIDWPPEVLRGQKKVMLTSGRTEER